MIHWSISPGDWSGMRVSSARWVPVAGSGSAERSDAKYWPGWRRRSSASARAWLRVSVAERCWPSRSVPRPARPAPALAVWWRREVAGCRVRWRGGRGFALEVAEPGVHGLPDHGVDLGDQGGPVPIPVCVAGLAGQAGVLPEGGVEDRDRLGQRQGQVEEQRALPGLLDGLGAQFALAFGGGVRLGGQQPAYRSAALRPLPGGLPSGVPSGALRSPNSRSYGSRSTVWPGSKPRARYLAPTSGRAALPRSRWPGCNSWPRPWPGRGRPASRCSQGHSPCSASRQPPTANPPSAGAAELPMLIGWCMGVTQSKRP